MHLGLYAQHELTLREKLRGKIWYLVKVMEVHDNVSGFSITTDFAFSDNKCYFFYLTCRSNRLENKSTGYSYGFPRELDIISDDKLVYYQSLINGSTKTVEYKVNSSSENFLEIEDEKGNRYFMVSGPLWY